MKFNNKEGKKVDVKISIIPIELCEFRGTQLNLVVVHGFGELPMMLITNLSSEDKRICVAVCKVYLMRWRIEEYFKFKKQSFDYENFRVRSLQSIRTLDFLLTMAIGYISKISDKQLNEDIYNSALDRLKKLNDKSLADEEEFINEHKALAKRIYENTDYEKYQQILEDIANYELEVLNKAYDKGLKNAEEYEQGVRDIFENASKNGVNLGESWITTSVSMD